MNQQQRILKHLQECKTIRPLEALNKHGVYRLSDTIFKLRKLGYIITTELVEIRNQFNEVCRVAEYQLHDNVS